MDAFATEFAFRWRLFWRSYAKWLGIAAGLVVPAAYLFFVDRAVQTSGIVGGVRLAALPPVTLLLALMGASMGGAPFRQQVAELEQSWSASTGARLLGRLAATVAVALLFAAVEIALIAAYAAWTMQPFDGNWWAVSTATAAVALASSALLAVAIGFLIGVLLPGVWGTIGIGLLWLLAVGGIPVWALLTSNNSLASESIPSSDPQYWLLTFLESSPAAAFTDKVNGIWGVGPFTEGYAWSMGAAAAVALFLWWIASTRFFPHRKLPLLCAAGCAVLAAVLILPTLSVLRAPVAAAEPVGKQSLPATELRMTALSVDVDLNRPPDLAAEAIVTVQATKPVNHVDLTLPPSLAVDAVRVDGQVIPYERQGKRLVIPLPLRAGEQRAVDVRYHGNPAQTKLHPYETMPVPFYASFLSRNGALLGMGSWYPTVSGTVPDPLEEEMDGTREEVFQHERMPVRLRITGATEWNYFTTLGFARLGQWQTGSSEPPTLYAGHLAADTFGTLQVARPLGMAPWPINSQPRARLTRLETTLATLPNWPSWRLVEAGQGQAGATALMLYPQTGAWDHAWSLVYSGGVGWPGVFPSRSSWYTPTVEDLVAYQLAAWLSDFRPQAAHAIATAGGFLSGLEVPSSGKLNLLWVAWVVEQRLDEGPHFSLSVMRPPSDSTTPTSLQPLAQRLARLSDAQVLHFLKLYRAAGAPQEEHAILQLADQVLLQDAEHDN